MTVRVAYTLCGQTPGGEFEELKSLVAMVPQGFGDDMLRFDGLGERITAAMNNNNRPTDAEKEKYYQIVRWAAERGMSLTMHWGNDASVGQLLDDFRAREQGSADRRAALVDRAPERRIGGEPDADESARHRLDRAGCDVFRRRALRAAGRRRSRAARSARRNRQEDRRRDRRRHRRASRGLLQSVHSLQWFLDGKTVGGTADPRPEETPDRAGALRFYTLGSAWFSFDERSADRSKSASSPTWPCSRRTT